MEMNRYSVRTSWFIPVLLGILCSENSTGVTLQKNVTCVLTGSKMSASTFLQQQRSLARALADKKLELPLLSKSNRIGNPDNITSAISTKSAPAITSSKGALTFTRKSTDSEPKYDVIVASLIALQVAILLAYGQPPICTCGYVKFWEGEIHSSGNSQHLTDWYTFSHVLHGFIFYGVTNYVAPNSTLEARFATAMAVEVGWELLENSPYVIERYRHTALALGYSGDSIINSISDTAAMAFGFFLAHNLPAAVTVILSLIEEIAFAFLIRDNLTLNIIQLLNPSEAINNWQSAVY